MSRISGASYLENMLIGVPTYANIDIVEQRHLNTKHRVRRKNRICGRIAPCTIIPSDVVHYIVQQNIARDTDPKKHLMNLYEEILDGVVSDPPRLDRVESRESNHIFQPDHYDPEHLFTMEIYPADDGVHEHRLVYNTNTHTTFLLQDQPRSTARAVAEAVQEDVAAHFGIPQRHIFGGNNIPIPPIDIRAPLPDNDGLDLALIDTVTAEAPLPNTITTAEAPLPNIVNIPAPLPNTVTQATRPYPFNPNAPLIPY